MFTLTQPFYRETNSILNPSISQLYQKRNLQPALPLTISCYFSSNKAMIKDVTKKYNT